MANPWDSDPIVGAAPSGPIYGAPPAEHTATPQNPEQRQNTLTNVAQGQQSLQLTPPKAAGDFIKDFSADPTVKAYREALPVIIGATQAQHNGAGDLSVVYGWAKAMDPTGSVREGDTQLAQSAAGPSQRAQFLVSQYRLMDGGVLPPEVRQGLIEEMRNKGRQLDLGYSQKYQQTQQLLKQAGIDPSILGPHEGDKYRAAEEGYVRSVNGPQTGPTDPSFVALHGGQPQGEGQFGAAPHDQPLPAGAEKIPGELAQALKTGAIPPDPYAIMGWAKEHGGYTISLDEAKRAAESVKKGEFPGAVVDPYKPDISDVRGGQNTTGQDQFNAGVRGLADTVTFGTADKLIAGADSLFKGGTMDENLARQYAISDFDSKQHPNFRIAGQIGGAAVLPMGEISSLPQLVGKSAAVGAGYGAGSSRSLSDVPMNALMGGTAGAATAATLGLAGKGINALRSGPKAVPDLVDASTGELNQPMDAMAESQRARAMKDFGINTVTPGMAGGRSARVIEQGFNNVPGSAGVMEDVNSKASGELRRAMQGVAQKFGSSKTLNEGGAELQRGAQERIGRSQTVTGKAYAAIPISDDAAASNASTVATLQSLTSRFQSNPDLAAAMKDPTLAKYLGAMEKGLNWKDLKDFRSIIGEKIGDARFGEGHSTKDLRALYGALSEDMKNTAASQGPRAVKAFERANNLYRSEQQLIEGSLTRILGKDGNLAPEKAAAAVQAMTKGGKASGDLKTLAQVKAATVKSGAWDEIASTLIHLGGQPANSEGRAFQPATFVNWYADMAEPARRMLFKPELRAELDRFVAVNQQLSRLKGLSNSSNTTPTMIGSGVVGASGMLAVTHPSALAIPIIAGAANYGMAKLWTNPKFVNLMTGYSKAAASGSPGAVKSQVGRLQKLAVTNPELRAGIEHLMKAIANDNAPTVGQLAASPNQGPDQQGQPQQ